MNTLTEGGVTVDSNVGTSDDLKAELATETPQAKPRNGKLTTLAETPAPDDGGDADEVVVSDAVTSAAGLALGKKKKSLQARIDEISTERHTTARERDQARADVARLQAELDEARGVKKPDAQPKTVAGVPIDAEKFPKYAEWLKTAESGKDDLEDWVDAREDWKSAKVESRIAAQRAENEVPEEAVKKFTSFHERMKPTLDADPKFYDKIDPMLTSTKAASALPKGAKVTFGNFIVELALKSEYPKEILLWLSEPETARRLGTLPPDDVIKEFAKKELSIRPADDSTTGPSADEHDDDDDDAPKRRQRPVEAATSQASPPIKPVRGSSQQSADQEPGDDASDDDWLRHERRKLQKARAH